MKHAFLLAALLAGAAVAAPPAGTKLAVAYAKSTHFTLSAPATVSYGDGSTWTEKDLGKGTHACSGPTFGLPATAATAGEQCRYTRKGGGLVVIAPPVVTPAPVLVKIAAEFTSFTLKTPTTVTFGLGGKTVSKQLAAGTFDCHRDTFGADPLPGIAKECSAPAGAAEVATPVPEKPAEPVVVAPPAPGAGITDPAEYRRVAALMGTQAGMEYLYGTAGGMVASNSYASVPASQPMNMVSIQNPNGKGNRGCAFGKWCGTFQLGGPLTYEPGDYSSSITNFLYTPQANPDKNLFKADRYFGVGAAQGIAIAHNTFSITPEPSWTTWQSDSLNGSHNEESVLAQIQGRGPAGTNGTDIFEGKPVAAARGYGRGGWTNNVLFAQSNGAITSHGSNTSRNMMLTRLPKGQTPTAIAVANSGEFALVTTWDTAAVKGKLWVLAMKDACQGCREENESAWSKNWGNWRNAMAGMPGLGNYIGAKILGSIDLPDDLKAPTGISMTTGRSPERHDGYETVMHLWETPIDGAAMRARFYNGDLKNAIASTGMAVVVSKGEKKAAFIDLRPLFAQVRKNWLAPMSDAEWQNRLKSRGDGDGKFPPTFNDVPGQKPVVIKTVDLPSAPTAVKTMLLAPFRSVVGTEDGNLHVFDLGTKYLDQTVGIAGSGKPADISEVGSYNVGPNPTSIAYVKGKSSQRPDGRRALWGYEKDDSFLWALSRGAKKAVLLKWNAGFTNFSEYMTVSDSRMTDPVALEDSDNHGTESYVLNVANGSSLLNYAYGPIIMYTYQDQANPPCSPAAPCGPTSPKSVMFGGEMKVPGNVWYVGGGNIN